MESYNLFWSPSQKAYLGAREMARCFRVLAALPQDRGSVPSTHTADPQVPVTTGLRGQLLSSGLSSHALSANTYKSALMLTHKGKTDKSSKCLTRLGVKQDMCASIHGCKKGRAISANVTHALKWLFS